MVQADVFSEDDRVELLEGEIIEMAPIGSRHAACVDRLNRALTLALAAQAIVRVQSPLRLSEHSEPQPDLAVLRARADFYAAAHPGPQNVLLVVEVGEASVDADREIKIPLYARFSIPEVWLIDLQAGVVELHRDPSPEGYRTVQRVQRGQALALQAFPTVSIPVDQVLA